LGGLVTVAGCWRRCGCVWHKSAFDELAANLAEDWGYVKQKLVQENKLLRKKTRNIRRAAQNEILFTQELTLFAKVRGLILRELVLPAREGALSENVAALTAN
jgi:hypothetical protein